MQMHRLHGLTPPNSRTLLLQFEFCTGLGPHSDTLLSRMTTATQQSSGYWCAMTAAAVRVAKDLCLDTCTPHSTLQSTWLI